MSMTIRELAGAIGAEIVGDADGSGVVDGVAGAEGAKEQSGRRYVAYWPAWMPRLTMCEAACAALIVPLRFARERWNAPPDAIRGAMHRIAFLGVDAHVDADLFAAQQRAAQALGVEAVEWRRPEDADAPRKPKRNRACVGEATREQAPQCVRDDRVAADVSRGRLPTTTFLLCRLPVFSPTQRPQERDGKAWFPTPWGKAKVKGRLGQRHADVLAALMSRGAAAQIPDGGIAVSVAVADVCRAARVSSGQLDVLLRQLRKAEIEIDAPATAAREAFTGTGGIIDHFSRATRAHHGTANLKGQDENGGAKVLELRLGKFFVALWRNDFALYQPSGELAAIQGLTSGVSQAVARFCKTHSTQPKGGWRVDTVLRAVAGEHLEGSKLRDARRALRRDAEALRWNFGIVVAPSNNGGGRVCLENVEQMPGSVEQMPEAKP